MYWVFCWVWYILEWYCVTDEYRRIRRWYLIRSRNHRFGLKLVGRRRWSQSLNHSRVVRMGYSMVMAGVVRYEFELEA